MQCPFCGSTKKSNNSLAQHKIRCHSNPDKIEHPRGFKGKTFSKEVLDHMSEERKRRFEDPEYRKRNYDQLRDASAMSDPAVRSKISESMKVAHKEGRAWNIGQSRWNNAPSWPEKFFMEVIKNEFNDQAYTTEYPFGKFSLDFAWLEKKKCIEIDGDQHLTDENQKRRDLEKNQLLEQHEWKLLRITWRDMMADTKFWIETAKKFIHE